MQKNTKQFIIQTKKGSFKVTIRHDKRDKAYLVKVPSLPDVVTFEKSISDAKRMAKDAIELYCDCVIAEGNKVIIDDRRQIFGKMPKSRIVSIVKAIV